MSYALLRPALFRLSTGDPERAHEWVMRMLALAARVPGPAGAALALGPPVRSRRLHVQCFGVDFPNPVGLAAGFDKNALALPAFAGLGFGFVEAGTVTLHPQPGNPRPRLLRLPEAGALINRMGFNNDGAPAVARRLARVGHLPVPLGISLGKSRVTSIEDAVHDYRASLRLLGEYADYIAVNVSSPNTPGLRMLQDREQIRSLIAALQEVTAALRQRQGRRLPLLVKVAPDLSDAALDDLLGVCLERGVDGLIAVNTTVARSGIHVDFAGGLSGRPLFARALAVVRRVRARTSGHLPVIGVGGIFRAGDAYAMIRAGASLVQIYTGLIYEGPTIARRINQGLLSLLERDGLRSVNDAVGSEG